MTSSLEIQVDLASAAKRAEAALKNISKASTSASKLRTGAIFGALGFCGGAAAAFAGLAAVQLLLYAPFLVPLSGICGLLVGVLASRSRADRANERSADVIDRVWDLRAREVAELGRRIKIARREQFEDVQYLKRKLICLELATPGQLAHYYGFVDRSVSIGHDDSSVDPGKNRLFQLSLPILDDSGGGKA